jgi:hypothetical protein
MQVWTVLEMSWDFKRDRLGRTVKKYLGEIKGDNHASAKANAQAKWPGKWLRLEQRRS